MSQTLPIVIISSLLAGGAGAVAATALTAKAPTPAEAAQSDNGDAILAQLESIAEMTRENAKRIEGLESAPTLAPVAGEMRTDAASTGLTEADVLALVKKVADEEVNAPNSVTAAKIEAVMEMREERERQERDQKRAEEREKRSEDRLAKMQQELGLDLTQMNQMRDLYLNRDEKRDDMRRQMREGFESGTMDRGAMREMWGALQEEHTAAVEGILTPTQFDQYKENGYDNDRGGRGGNRGGDNAGGGGGNQRGGGNARGGGGGGRRGGF